MITYLNGKRHRSLAREGRGPLTRLVGFVRQRWPRIDAMPTRRCDDWIPGIDRIGRPVLVAKLCVGRQTLIHCSQPAQFFKPDALFQRVHLRLAALLGQGGESLLLSTQTR
jgi:hypothetical protein